MRWLLVVGRRFINSSQSLPSSSLVNFNFNSSKIFWTGFSTSSIHFFFNLELKFFQKKCATVWFMIVQFHFMHNHLKHSFLQRTFNNCRSFAPIFTLSLVTMEMVFFVFTKIVAVMTELNWPMKRHLKWWSIHFFLRSLLMSKLEVVEQIVERD